MRLRGKMISPGLNDEQFAALYDERAEALLGFFARRTLDAQVALDLWAETLAQAWAGRGRFRGTTDEEAVSWLYGIAYRQLAAYARRGRAERRALRRLGLDSPAADDQDLVRVEQLVGLAELRSQVKEQLGRLPHSQQEAVRLRVVDELPYDEIADRLHINQQNARMRVSRALRALAQTIDPKEVKETHS
jgi:RNA polymerase sigma-70 factor (ECF subfamily)